MIFRKRNLDINEIKMKKIFAEYKGLIVCRIDSFHFVFIGFFPRKPTFPLKIERERTLLETKPICRQNLNLYLNLIYLSKFHSLKRIKYDIRTYEQKQQENQMS